MIDYSVKSSIASLDHIIFAIFLEFIFHFFMAHRPSFLNIFHSPIYFFNYDQPFNKFLDGKIL